MTDIRPKTSDQMTNDSGESKFKLQELHEMLKAQGLQIRPIKPTPEMIASGGNYWLPEDIYKAMNAAFEHALFGE